MSDFMNDPLWYKEAVIYELHVRSFYDADNDGYGDFEGLRRKLPYLESLGVNTLWLLPFVESPLKDDGYDTSDYTRVLPVHGTMDDFKAFLEEAHERDMRVITELVLNHTSDQHPWFQEARNPASDKHDWYVWSETTDRYSETRVIFTDTEYSNWTWDPKTGKYYWHRFFSHQPDLNYDNPEVRQKMKEVMFFWLDMGVDGLRLDAVPYLYEREGTTSENLPATIDYVKELRAAVDERYGPGRVLLAEANQWPENTLPYFGEDDEGQSTGVQMAFNFPVMPRLYMALRRENRRPLVEMLDLTSGIPEDAQWAIFLRNHDELTLEMVTDEERDYMYHEYAADKRFRINVGIRRRLTPLLGGERRRIELMYALLFSLKGSPIIYYGDEIGMGDDPFLGDRNGVRTPMQWSADKNGGFSRASHHRLFMPPINRGPYSYEFINVEDAEQDEHSLLHFMRRVLTLRQQHAGVFGRGSLEVVPLENQSLLAFVRAYEGQKVLVVANLSRYAQSVHFPAGIELYRGMVPVELFSQTPFPAFGEDPYHMVLGPHGFYWFELKPETVAVEEAEQRRSTEKTELPGALPLLEVEEGLENLLVRTMFRGRGPERLEALLPDYVSKQRWFGAKGQSIEAVEVEDAVRLQAQPHPVYLSLISVRLSDETAHYVLPLAISYESAAERLLEEWPKAVLAWVDVPQRRGLLHDATVRPDFWSMLFKWWQSGSTGRSLRGIYESRLAEAARGSRAEEVRLIAGEQSNTSAIINGEFFVKLYRRLERGPHPETEMLEYLTDAGFTFIPRLLGTIDFKRGRRVNYPLGVLQEALPVESDGWHYALEVAGRLLDRVAGQKFPAEAASPQTGALGEPAPAWLEEVASEMLSMADVLGVRTAELHRTLARAEAPDMKPLPNEERDVEALVQRVRSELETTRAMLEERGDTVDVGLPSEEAWAKAVGCLETLEGGALGGLKIRIHGDYHLGQVLRADGEFYILDFEGEPARTVEERRERDHPLRDVAGMMRSFDYAAQSALQIHLDRARAAEEAATEAAQEETKPEEGASRTGTEQRERPSAITNGREERERTAAGNETDGAEAVGEDAPLEEEARATVETSREDMLRAWTEALAEWCQALFLDGYATTVEAGAEPSSGTTDDAEGSDEIGLADSLEKRRTLLWIYLLDKALYEVRYELNHRPGWLWLPLRGLRRLLNEAAQDETPGDALEPEMEGASPPEESTP